MTDADRTFAAALAEARQAIANDGTGAWSDLTDADREWLTTQAGRWLTALARIAKPRTESGSRVTIDGYVAHEGTADAGLARARVEYHAAKRRENPDWRGNAEALRRTHYVTPWDVVASSEEQSAGLDAAPECPSLDGSRPCGRADCLHARAMHDDGETSLLGSPASATPSPRRSVTG